MWYIYTMEFYSAIKNKEFMKFLGKWKELENIILSEVTQSQKNTHAMHITDKWILAQKLRIPKIQFTDHVKLKKKTKVWILQSFLEGGTKYPWRELQRQSVEQRLKE